MWAGQEVFARQVRCPVVLPTTYHLKTAICQTGCQRGTCVDSPGECICEEGFSGTNCSICLENRLLLESHCFQQAAHLAVEAHARFQTLANVRLDSTVPCVTYVGFMLSCRSFTLPAVYCEMKFSGGNWALVRHAPEGQIWHNATSFIAPFSLF
jgi:hypothetical protein